MSAVLHQATFHLHDYRNDRVRKNSLGSISITASFRSNLPFPRENHLVYSEWQSVHTEMLVAMTHIEFVKGIPMALEQDSYFDANKRNLNVADDRMIDASKDKHTMNLFTRGSRHQSKHDLY